MKIGKIKTFYIILLSIIYTIQICVCAIIRHLFKIINQTWIDNIINIWSDRLLNLVNVNYKIINPYKISPLYIKNAVIMCNHSSLYDIPLCFKIFPKYSIRMLAKQELYRIPIFGLGMLISGFIFIDRKNKYQLNILTKKIKELMKKQIVICIYPEGIRSTNGKLLPFKKGIFIPIIKSRAKIIPVGIHGAHNILPAKTITFNINQKVNIHIGNIIDTDKYNINNIRELMNIVHSTIYKLIDND